MTVPILPDKGMWKLALCSFEIGHKSIKLFFRKWDGHNNPVISRYESFFADGCY